MDAKRLHSLARNLKANVQTRLPVSVRLVDFPPRKFCVGDCTHDGLRFWVQVAKGLDTDEALGTLLHEYAHAVSWGLDGEDHGEWFQEARRVCFQQYLRWLRGA